MARLRPGAGHSPFSVLAAAADAAGVVVLHDGALSPVASTLVIPFYFRLV